MSAAATRAPVSPTSDARVIVQSRSGRTIQVKYFASAENHRADPFSTFPLEMSFRSYRFRPALPDPTTIPAKE